MPTIDEENPIRRLLVAIDESDASVRALEPALQSARRSGVGAVLFGWAPHEAAAPMVKEHLETLAGDLPELTTEMAVTGDATAAPAIAAAAERTGATVCMATHGRSGPAQRSSAAWPRRRCGSWGSRAC